LIATIASAFCLAVPFPSSTDFLASFPCRMMLAARAASSPAIRCNRAALASPSARVVASSVFCDSFQSPTAVVTSVTIAPRATTSAPTGPVTSEPTPIARFPAATAMPLYAALASRRRDAQDAHRVGRCSEPRRDGVERRQRLRRHRRNDHRHFAGARCDLLVEPRDRRADLRELLIGRPHEHQVGLERLGFFLKRRNGLRARDVDRLRHALEFDDRGVDVRREPRGAFLREEIVDLDAPIL
jgi:hypothetical protein